MNQPRPKVLLGSPIRQKPDVLREFLSGIERLRDPVLYQLDYSLIDDNVEPASRLLLAGFSTACGAAVLTGPPTPDSDTYRCDEVTHIWEEDLIWKVAGFKNHLIAHALAGDYDFLFLVDSDLVLQPQTLGHLLGLQKDIVAEVFWTRWEPGFPELPQVWMSDQYNLYKAARGEPLTQEEILRRVQDFLAQLRLPGTYPVGGLGACTLISRKALQEGVNFNEIPNLSFVGEDRHFCVRAAALGFELYVDTHYPAFHIYRPSDLERL